MSDDVGVIAALSARLPDAEIARAVRSITADPWIQDHPESLVVQLEGWLSSAARPVGSIEGEHDG